MRNLLGNIFYLIGEKFFTTVLLLSSNIIIIRYLGVRDFGHLALFQIYYNLAVTVSEFGIRRIYSSLKTPARESLIFSQALLIKYFSSGVLFIICFGYLFYEKINIEFYAILLAFIASPFEIYTYHFEANLDNQLLSKVRVFVSFILSILRIVLCFLHTDMFLLILSFAINNIMINFICFAITKKRKMPIKHIRKVSHKKIIRAHLFSRSLFFWISVIIVQLNMRTDQLMISFLTGSELVGIYAGAYKIIEQFLTIPSLLAGVFLPYISKTANLDKYDYLRKLYLYSILICMPLTILAVVFAPFILPMLLGAAFTRSVPVFQILVISLPILVIVNLSGLYYSIFKLEKFALIRNFFGLIFSLLLNYIFIVKFGVNGAALSVLISYFLVAFVVEWFLPATRKNASIKFSVLKNLFVLNTYRMFINDIQFKIKQRKKAKQP